MLKLLAAGADAVPLIAAAVSDLGYDQFEYYFTPSAQLTADATTFVLTNAAPAWTEEYAERRLIESDPRLPAAARVTGPVGWSRAEFPKTKRSRAFFDCADRYGISSGLAVALRVAPPAHAWFLGSSASRDVSPSSHRKRINAAGDFLVLATYLHECCLQKTVQRQANAAIRTIGPLSARERECVQLASRGLSSAKIGVQLGISRRTVEMHWAHILTKSGCANRNEVIALAARTALSEMP